MVNSKHTEWGGLHSPNSSATHVFRGLRGHGGTHLFLVAAHYLWESEVLPRTYLKTERDYTTLLQQFNQSEHPMNIFLAKFTVPTLTILFPSAYLRCSITDINNGCICIRAYAYTLTASQQHNMVQNGGGAGPQPTLTCKTSHNGEFFSQTEERIL